jgi:HSP90 family molecular chaperone
MTTYYYVTASKKFMVDTEPTHEIMKERLQDYHAKEKAIDFWLVEQPTFLDRPELASVKAQVPQPAAAIVSTNKQFITWLKLRLEYVITGEFQTEDATTAIASLQSV